MKAMSSECAGCARDLAKVEDQVRFLARTLFTMRFEARFGRRWASGARRHVANGLRPRVPDVDCNESDGQIHHPG